MAHPRIRTFKHFTTPKSGVWFTVDPKGASDYAAENDSQNLKYDHSSGKFQHVHTASRVIPVYVKIMKPKYSEGYPQKEIGHAQNYKKALGEYFDKLRSEGYDALIITHNGEPIVYALIANDPTRIKSAISNRGYTNKKNIHEKAIRQTSGAGDPFVLLENPTAQQVINDDYKDDLKEIKLTESLPGVKKRYNVFDTHDWLEYGDKFSTA